MNGNESTDLRASFLVRLEKQRTAYLDAMRDGRHASLDALLEPFSPDELSLAIHELLFVEFTEALPSEATLNQYRQRFAQFDQAVLQAYQRARRKETHATMTWDTKSIAEPDHNTHDVDGLPREDDEEQTLQQSAQQANTASHLTKTPSVGEYEILGELGRGGMGIVYRARQRSANRTVALKVIRSDRLAAFDDSSRREVIDRFMSEAQAAAGLDHDNIVTVYEVSSRDGQPFYSMRFVDGDSLSDLMREGPLDGVRASRYMQGVCRAIQAAHDQHILHRDLKPSNVIIDRRTDRALVADFGLAKLMTTEQSATQTGAIIGTPPYMAPEQTRDASRVTEAADIYGIGATLYHLLTGRPPFQTPSIVETIRQVNADEPVAPRRLNPAVHVDLETICLKCLEKEPKRRYESAREVELELTRFLSGDPIAASPINRLQRLARWSAQHPAVASLAGVATVLLMLLVISLAVGYVQVSNALARATDARADADAQAEAAEENLQTAFLAADTAFTRIATDPELKRYGLESLRLQLLQDVVPLLEEFTDRAPEDASFAFAQAVALKHLGNVQAELGKLRVARTQLEKAKAQFDSQRTATPGANIEMQYAAVCSDLARVCLQQGDREASLALNQDALAVYSTLMEQGEATDEAILSLAALHGNLATAESVHLDRPNRVRTHFEEAIRFRRSFRELHPEHVDNEIGYANVLINYGNFLQSSTEFDRASELYQSAQAVLSQQELDLERHPNFLRTRSVLEYELGVLAFNQLFFEPAEAHFRESIADAETMVELHPIVPEDRRRLISTRLALAAVQQKLKRDAQTIQPQLEQALVESRNLASDFGLPVHRADVSRALETYANFWGKNRNLERNKELMLECLSIRESLHFDFPDNGEFLALLANAHYNLAVVLDNLDEDVDAEAEYLLAKARYEQLMQDPSQVRAYGADYGNTLNNLIVLYLEQQRMTSATAVIQESLPILQQTQKLNSAMLISVGRLQMLIGEQFLADENLKQAEAYLSSAIESLDKFLEGRDNDAADTLLASALMSRAEVYGRTDRFSQGKLDWQRALEHAPKVTLLELQIKRGAWMLRYGSQKPNDQQ